jgi:hypothetical protein
MTIPSIAAGCFKKVCGRKNDIFCGKKRKKTSSH